MRFLTDYAAMLGDCLRLALVGRGIQRWRRLRFLALWVIVFPAAFLLAVSFLALDHLLYPGFKQVRVDRPIFIVGNMRTGSTWLQRMLQRDPEGIATFRTIDMLLPSVTQRRVAALLGRIDRALGGYGRRVVGAVDRLAFEDYSRIHDSGLFKTEEDEFINFLWLRASAMAEAFPGVPRFRRYLHPDASIPAAELDGHMAWYRGVAQRLVYSRGGAQRFVAKNPLHSTKVAAIARAFPDARFIYLVRDPRRSVPSTCSLLHYVWWESGALHPDDKDVDFVVELCSHHMRDPLRRLASLPADRFAVLRYEDLVDDPARALRETFAQLDLPVTPGLARVLDAERRQTHTSSHQYDLAQWGLSEEGLYAALPDIFECFGYGRPGGVSLPVADDTSGDTVYYGPWRREERPTLQPMGPTVADAK